MTSLRFVLPLACLLCLTCSVSAQNFTASTPFANLTLVAQVNSNFSANVATPSFPCDNSSPGLVGGYSDLDQDDEQAGDDLYYISNAVFNYYLYATANFTGCSVLGDSSFNASRACSQVSNHCFQCYALALRVQCHTQAGFCKVLMLRIAWVQMFSDIIFLYAAGCEWDKLCCRA